MKRTPRPASARWKRAALIAGSTTALVLLAARVAAPELLRAKMQRTLSEKLGTAVTIHDVDLAPLACRVMLEGLAVTNPPGFDSTEFLRVERVSVDAGLTSLLGGGPLTFAIAADGIALHFERRADGRSNAAEVIPNWRKAKEAAAAQPAQALVQATSTPAHAPGAVGTAVKPAKSPASPRVSVTSLTVSGLAITFANAEGPERYRGEARASLRRLAIQALTPGGDVTYSVESAGFLVIGQPGFPEHRLLAVGAMTASPIRAGTARAIGAIDVTGVQADWALANDGRSNWRRTSRLIEAALGRDADPIKDDDEPTPDPQEAARAPGEPAPAPAAAPKQEEPRGRSGPPWKVDRINISGSMSRARREGEAWEVVRFPDCSATIRNFATGKPLEAAFSLDSGDGSASGTLTWESRDAGPPNAAFVAGFKQFPAHAFLWDEDRDAYKNPRLPLANRVFLTGELSGNLADNHFQGAANVVVEGLDVRRDTRGFLDRLKSPTGGWAAALSELADAQAKGDREVRFAFGQPVTVSEPFLVWFVVRAAWKQEFARWRLALLDQTRGGSAQGNGTEP